MEDLKKIWSEARELIRPQISAVTFHRWIDSLDPVVVQNEILVLEAENDVVKNTVTEYYFDYVRTAVRKAEPGILDVILILPAQRRDFVRIASDEVPLNSLTLYPRYTFDTFVVGKSNNFAHAAALAVVEAPGMARRHRHISPPWPFPAYAAASRIISPSPAAHSAASPCAHSAPAGAAARRSTI